jgi:hypothetical protein
MTPGELATWVERSRGAQGLGPVVVDPAILARVWTLAFAGQGGGGPGPPSNRPPGGGRRAQNPAKEPSTPDRTRAAEPGQERTDVRRGVMAVPGDDESRGTPQHPGPGPITATDGTTILADRQRRARSRIRAMDERRRVCRQLNQIANLATYYGSRSPRAIPLARFLAEGWWAA